MKKLLVLEMAIVIAISGTVWSSASSNIKKERLTQRLSIVRKLGKQKMQVLE